MAVNTQFSIAVHILAGLGYRCDGNVTSSRLAYSVNTSPSFVRRILAKLSKAKLVHTTTGKTGACCLARNPADISLLEVYQAVDAPKAFAIHNYTPQKPCPVSCQIRVSLEGVLHKTQKSLEDSLAKITVADVISDLKRK